MDIAVVATFIVVALGQILAPLGLGIWVKKKFNVSWKIFGLGALFFVVVQMIHVPLVLLTQPTLTAYLLSFLDLFIVIIILGIYLGLLAGLFEEPGRYIVFRKIFPRMDIKLNKKTALMFGIGWGGIESIFIAVIMLLSTTSYMSAVSLTDQDLQDINDQYGGILTQEQLDAIKAQNEAFLNLTPVDVLPSLFERLMTIVIHIGFTLMIFSAIMLSRRILLYLAILWHAALDFFAVVFMPLYGVWVTEGMLLMFAVIALLYIRRVWNRKN